MKLACRSAKAEDWPWGSLGIRPFGSAQHRGMLSDYVYVHRLNWTGIDAAKGSLRIEPEQLLSVSEKELGELTKNYGNGRVKRFLKSWRKSLP